MTDLVPVSFWSGRPDCQSIDFRYVAGMSGQIDLYPDSTAENGQGNLIGLSIVYFENLSPTKRKQDLPQFSDQYFLDRVDADMLDTVRGGKTFLFIDYSGEPCYVIDDILTDFHAELDKRSIPSNQVIISTCNHVFKAAYLSWCQANNTQPIHVVSYDHFIYHFAATISTNSIEARNEIRQRIANRGPITDATKKYLCLNNMPRGHRYAIGTLLFELKLEKEGILSFLQPLELQYQDDTWGYVESLLRDYDISRESFDRLMNAIPIEADRNFQHSRGDLASGLGDYDMYAQSRFSVVTESDLEANTNTRITEKILKPIVNGHFFVCLGNYDCLSRLRDHGFVSYAPEINESYNQVLEGDLRFAAAMREMLRLINLPNETFTDMYASAKDRILQNYDLVWDLWKTYSKDALHRQIRDIIAGKPATS